MTRPFTHNRIAVRFVCLLCRILAFLILAIFITGCEHNGTDLSVVFRDIDQEAGTWDGYEEGTPSWILENVTTPALDGTSLRCGLTGGAPYSNIHCYKNLSIDAPPQSFCFDLLFWFEPQTTYNNQGAPSIVQALEFSTSAWWQGVRYELALQWQNVGHGAPQWHYWDGQQQWVSTGIAETLEAGQWHAFTVEGEIIDGAIFYTRFILDRQQHALSYVVPPVIALNEPDRLAVAVQLDGNATNTPYDLFIESVNLSINGSCPVLPVLAH
jgi:hypothetical protein